MKTNLIEITVSGRTGSGKSEVLEVIKKALENFYSRETYAVAHSLPDVNGAIEEAKHTGQTAKSNKTVFVLYEQNISGEIIVHE